MTSTQSVTAGPSRREVLVELRDRLAAELDASHRPGCACECGPVGDGRILAGLSKELRAVVAELDALPVAEEASRSADLRKRVADRWGTGA